MMNDELLDLVNGNDEVVATVWKSEAHGDTSKIHREIAIAVFNKSGETLLHQRSLTKKYDPGMWQITAAGHVGANEDPKTAATREVAEEVGILCEPIFVKKEFIKDDNEARFFYVYYSVVENNIQIQLKEDEVIDAKWVYPNDIEKFVSDNNFKIDWKSKEFVQEIARRLINN